MEQKNILRSFGVDIQKSVYKDNEENRKLGRVGQAFGGVELEKKKDHFGKTFEVVTDKTIRNLFTDIKKEGYDMFFDTASGDDMAYVRSNIKRASVDHGVASQTDLFLERAKNRIKEVIAQSTGTPKQKN